MAVHPLHGDMRERAERHAEQAEKLLKSLWLSSHVKAQAHAALAVYYTLKSAQ